MLHIYTSISPEKTVVKQCNLLFNLTASIYICTMELVYRLDEIENAAGKVLELVNGHRVLTFSGEMGAGKTTLIHALCRGLGVTGVLSSPTFSIVNEYISDRGPVFHIDLYRCKNIGEVIGAGVEDCLYSGNICMVEWPSRADSLFDELALRVAITEIDNKTRKLVVNPKLEEQGTHNTIFN
jgi:tRNA threonylcarbamoyladenosine biosynthesis protein TsaE